MWTYTLDNLDTAPITNGLATVIINGLECGVTYTIIAGGARNEELLGPSRLHGNFSTCACPINMMSKFCVCTYLTLDYRRDEYWNMIDY